MRAVVFNAAQDVAVTDLPEPKTGKGQVKVQVAYNGICGTDLHEYLAGPILVPSDPHPLTANNLPVVLGHEFSGTVVEVGAGVTDLREGDRIAVEPLYRCDACLPCHQGRYNVCAKVGFVGLSSDGGMAEYALIEERMAHKLPDNVSTELGALVEPMSVAFHAAKRGVPEQDGTAVVFGAGPIGVGLWYGLRGQGIDDVVVVEPSPSRRTGIERLGARTLDPTNVDVPAFVADHTNGAGASAAYDAAGVQASVETALACVGATKPVVSVAIYEQPLQTPLLQLVMKEARIQGTLCYTSEDYRAVLELMSQGHYDTTGWVEQVALGDVVSEGLEALRTGSKMKVLLDPSR